MSASQAFFLFPYVDNTDFVPFLMYSREYISSSLVSNHYEKGIDILLTRNRRKFMKEKLNVLITGKEMCTIKTPFAVLAADDYITVDVVALDLDKLLTQIHVFQPDVIIFSVSLYDKAVIKQISMIKEILPVVKTMLLMSTLDNRFIIEGLVVGIDGFLLDDGSSDTRRLLENIHDLYQKGYVISEGIVRQVVHQMKAQRNKRQLEENLQTYDICVTKRELDTLYLLMENYSNQEMASLFGVKVKSVRAYVSNAYSKIGIHKRDKAISFLKQITDSASTLQLTQSQYVF